MSSESSLYGVYRQALHTFQLFNLTSGERTSPPESVPKGAGTKGCTDGQNNGWKGESVFS